jgi:prevent-host-death family protein
MKHFSATDAKNKFGELMEVSGNEPVAIQKNGRDVRILLSSEEYERLTGTNPVRPLIMELHKRSIERRREVYEELAK